MSPGTIVALTVLAVSVVLIYVMVRAKTLGPLVMTGVILGAAAGVSLTMLIGGMT